ncbi:hypothetical protein [Fibrobacter sp. UWB12]|uniref:hypothetical protein n=1 Tax=Fibrobacter sp. UWB12 TaxID=1896203 RepID=UPI0009139375|nr:hypothetical protein [Fibrobacter sp. UWB12]SHK87361.1 hypothetical protein SAMN05720759_10816 [Fibrobacter sp. UWB12]
MTDSTRKEALQITEVPPELRGLSDEEIIKNSESKEKKFIGKKHNGAKRPSKRERQKLKEQNEKAKFNSLVAKYNKADSSKSQESENDAEIKSILKKIHANAPKREDVEVKKAPVQATPTEPPKRVLKSVISEPPKPPSGRVLKGSFGVKPGDKPKTVIVSAADLARQRIEERAKKIREALMAKNKALHPEAAAEMPVKRPRGRPRKNPLPPAE